MYRNPQPRKKESQYVVIPFELSDMQCDNSLRTFNKTALNNSIIGIAGDDYAFVATSINLNMENDGFLHRIAKRLVLASTGSTCNSSNLAASLRARLYLNENLRGKYMKPHCVALLLSCLLTNGHADPLQDSFMIAGLDEKGKGVIYAYDRLGYHESTPFRAMGNSRIFMQQYLTDVIRSKNSQSQLDPYSDSQSSQRKDPPSIDFDEALEIIIQAFQAVSRFNNNRLPQKLLVSGITKDGVCLEELCIY